MSYVACRITFSAAITTAMMCFAVAAAACPCDNESYAAEAESLPCVFEAVLGTFPKHSQAFHLARVQAAEAVLDWAPTHLAALDAKGIALLRLGRPKDAEPVMLRRAQLAPAAYRSHAGLATLYAFTGDFTKALESLDTANTLEPTRSTGHASYERKLVVFLRDVQTDPGLVTRENFLRIPIDPQARLDGSDEAFARAGGNDDALDALASMTTVYDANRLPHVYFALAELLALRGKPRLAWTAYQRALEFEHPRADEIRAWQKALSDALRAAYLKDPKAWAKRLPAFPGLPAPYSQTHPDHPFKDLYYGIRGTYWELTRGTNHEFSQYADGAKAFTAWEAQEVAKGLPVWREDGLTKVYARANALRPRCQSPGVVLDTPILRTSP